MSAYQIIERPVITEKSTKLARLYDQYTFEVSYQANKIQIKQAVEKAFDVDVLKVNTSIMPSKERRWGHKPAWKKAVVTIHPGQVIEGFVA
ncbi:MAG: 50S ribosomal protein L23 [Chloroflexota bacterium]|nr:50S ribosomal protein L23 [Chloroflexota bacterium]